MPSHSLFLLIPAVSHLVLWACPDAIPTGICSWHRCNPSTVLLGTSFSLHHWRWAVRVTPPLEGYLCFFLLSLLQKSPIHWWRCVLPAEIAILLPSEVKTPLGGSLCCIRSCRHREVCAIKTLVQTQRYNGRLLGLSLSSRNSRHFLMFPSTLESNSLDFAN